MDIDKQKEKQRTKQLLLQKLKNLKIKSQSAPSVVSLSQSQRSIPEHVPIKIMNQIKISNNQKEALKMAQRKQSDDESQMENKQHKLMNEQDEKDNELREKKNLRIKRPYYQHYSKQGVFQPILEYVRNHPNPSGKPPNIPPQMYEGIQVVPKRPWVFFGPQNIPPSDCQQINEKTFSVIFEQAKKNKGSGVFKKSNKKKGMKKHEDEISEVSEDFTSNFTFSDSVDLSKQSDLISQFRTQTKTLKAYDSSHMQSSYAQDDFSSVSGSVTQRQRYNLFDSSESQQQKGQESIEVSRRRKKFKKLLQSSDEQPQKNSVYKGSSFQGSSAAVNAGSSGNPGSGQQNPSDKGSSAKVEVDDRQSSISISKSRAQQARNDRQQLRSQRIEKNQKPNRKSARLRKPKKQEQSDS